MGSKISCLKKNETKGCVKTQKPWKLSLLGLECILMYLDFRIRFDLSLDFPRFHIIEKRCLLTTNFLRIWPQELEIGKTLYRFKDHRKEMKTGAAKTQKDVERDVLQFVYKLFAGRTYFRVKKLYIQIKIPFRLNIDCGTVCLSPCYGKKLEFYLNVVRKVDCLVIGSVSSPNELKDPWVRSMKTVETFPSVLAHFLPELPNLLAETIYVTFFTYVGHCDDLIEAWCESRNGRVGSQLFMYLLNYKDVLTSSRLAQIGFIADSNDERWRLRMMNNSEARLSIRDDCEYFTNIYELSDPHLRRTLCLEVVQL